MGPDPVAIGPYAPLRLLGEGGMGKVFLARSPGSRLVALKVIRPEYADDPGFRERFRREADAARKVSGFFTTPVIDADAEGTQPWLATSYVPAPSLSEIVRRYGRMPEPALRALGAGLAEALIAIHAAGLIHRDLKPGNVLVAEDGPRVIDFGISRALDGTQVTRTGGMVGTPGYMSPEQVASGREIGAASDVFSLGCVLVFAATGVHPFGDGDAATLLYRVVYEEPKLDGVPGGLRGVVEDCLAKDPAARPPLTALLERFAPAHPGALLTVQLRQELAARGQEAASIISGPAMTPAELTGPLPSTVPPVPPAAVSTDRRRFLGLAAGGAVAVAAATTAAILLADDDSGKAGGSGGARSGSKGDLVVANVGGNVPEGPAISWTGTSPSHSFKYSGLARVGTGVAWWDEEWANIFDAVSGAKRWEGEPKGSGRSAGNWLGVFGGTLYGTSSDDDLRAVLFGVDGNGRQLFSHTCGPDAKDAPSSFMRLFDVGGGVALIEVSGTRQSFLAVDVATGRPLWTRPMTKSWGAAVTDGRRAYLQDYRTTRALNLRSGAEIWATPNTNAGGESPHMAVCPSAGVVTVTSLRVEALDLATGRRRWNAVTQSTMLDKPVIQGERAYLADSQNRVRALDLRSGREVWNTEPPVRVDGGSVGSGMVRAITSVSGAVLALPLGSDRPGVLAMDPASGKTLWAHGEAPAGDDKSYQSALVIGKSVYAASGTSLYAFKEK
ncbi:serine/threonine-protein kinase [Actinomadura barringtoniae]|uniref:Serine/threonine-protein kinase n=1 Tax=Actinomadura barringtoniae TaxID=1427535 RepID=A0A939PNS1_9ACTN|nr:serine/threonine-protein kinase [Actinomadura barringtoniae]MBO2455630.1 serine/threonine-protein kinase [Actinomadura barringtoniae]